MVSEEGVSGTKREIVMGMPALGASSSMQFLPMPLRLVQTQAAKNIPDPVSLQSKLNEKEQSETIVCLEEKIEPRVDIHVGGSQEVECSISSIMKELCGVKWPVRTRTGHRGKSLSWCKAINIEQSIQESCFEQTVVLKREIAICLPAVVEKDIRTRMKGAPALKESRQTPVYEGNGLREAKVMKIDESITVGALHANIRPKREIVISVMEEPTNISTEKGKKVVSLVEELSNMGCPPGKHFRRPKGGSQEEDVGQNVLRKSVRKSSAPRKSFRKSSAPRKSVRKSTTSISTSKYSLLLRHHMKTGGSMDEEIVGNPRFTLTVGDVIGCFRPRSRISNMFVSGLTSILLLEYAHARGSLEKYFMDSLFSDAVIEISTCKDVERIGDTMALSALVDKYARIIYKDITLGIDVRTSSRVMIPVLDDGHWWCCDIDIQQRKINIFDSYHTCDNKKEVICKELAKVMHTLMSCIGMRTEILGVPWNTFDVFYIDDFPVQQNNTDCGVYMCCALEFWCGEWTQGHEIMHGHPSKIRGHLCDRVMGSPCNPILNQV